MSRDVFLKESLSLLWSYTIRLNQILHSHHFYYDNNSEDHIGIRLIYNLLLFDVTVTIYRVSQKSWYLSEKLLFLPYYKSKIAQTLVFNLLELYDYYPKCSYL